MNFVFYRKFERKKNYLQNPHTESLSNTMQSIAFTSYDLLSTSHVHAKLLKIEYWFCATCTIYIHCQWFYHCVYLPTIILNNLVDVQ